MLKIIVIAAAVVILVPVAVVLVLAAGKPDTFRLQRSTTVAAPPDAVYPLVVDFRRWAAWSPWEAKDPAMRRSYGAVASGEGAEYAWEGNKDVGKGRMRITEAREPSRVALELHFEQPFEAHNSVAFAFEPTTAGTEVTWTMQGPTPFLAKIVHVFVDMDRMVGGDFEAGLAKLKTAAEDGRS